jgi:CRISPR-associated endonuclease Csn1
MTKRPYRLGLDVGSNSLGWFAVWLDGKGEPSGLGPGGVRIYPDGRDPQSGTSNAVDRRMARGARRRRDRYLRRRSLLMSLLVRHGLMPDDLAARKALETLDPYELRAKALDEVLPAHHVGRALFHLNQRRGFLSNRKTEKKEDKESGAIRLAASRLKESMKGASADTLGEFFHRRHTSREIEVRQGAIRAELERLGKDRLTGNARKKAWAKIRKRLFPDTKALAAPLPVRARNRSMGPKAEYDFYPTRQLLLEEFAAIWNGQAPHHPSMTGEARDAIHEAIFFQRQLKQPPLSANARSTRRRTRTTPKASGVLGRIRSPSGSAFGRKFAISKLWKPVVRIVA